MNSLGTESSPVLGMSPYAFMTLHRPLPSKDRSTLEVIIAVPDCLVLEQSRWPSDTAKRPAAESRRRLIRSLGRTPQWIKSHLSFTTQSLFLLTPNNTQRLYTSSNTTNTNRRASTSQHINRGISFPLLISFFDSSLGFGEIAEAQSGL